MRNSKRNLWLIAVAVLAIGCDPPDAVVEKTAPLNPPSAAVDSNVERNDAPSVDATSEPEFQPSAALAAFLPKFDAISSQGFVPTLRRGSTGIGYTLETMLEIEENNSPGGDFMGMELKAFRDDDLTMDDSETVSYTHLTLPTNREV